MEGKRKTYPHDLKVAPRDVLRESAHCHGLRRVVLDTHHLLVRRVPKELSDYSHISGGEI